MFNSRSACYPSHQPTPPLILPSLHTPTRKPGAVSYSWTAHRVNHLPLGTPNAAPWAVNRFVCHAGTLWCLVQGQAPDSPTLTGLKSPVRPLVAALPLGRAASSIGRGSVAASAISQQPLSPPPNAVTRLIGEHVPTPPSMPPSPTKGAGDSA